MKTSEQPVQVLDYRQESASDAIVPNPAVLSSSGWDSLHFEHHQQPTFETIEHQHTMHVIAYGLSGSSVGERWLDGKRTRETKEQRRHRDYPGRNFPSLQLECSSPVHDFGG